MCPTKYLGSKHAMRSSVPVYVDPRVMAERAYQNIHTEKASFLGALSLLLREDSRKSSVLAMFPDMEWEVLESSARDLLRAKDQPSNGRRRPGRPRKASNRDPAKEQAPENDAANGADGSRVGGGKEKIFTQFTKPELGLIVSEWYSPGSINFQYIQEECFLRDLNSIHSKVMQLETNYGDKRQILRSEEILAFEVCNEMSEYTLEEVSALLPGYSVENLRKLIHSHYPHKLVWSAGETAYILKCLRSHMPLRDIWTELIFRRPSEVKAKATALAKRHRITSYFKTSVEKSEYEARIATFIEKGLTKETLQATEKEIQKDLNSWLKAGYFMDRPERHGTRRHGTFFREDVEAEIARRGGSSALPFTKAENNIINNKIQGEMTTDECQKELIFRKPSEIRERLRKAELVTVRQKKFANNMERLIYEAQWYSSMADNATGGRKRRARQGVELEQLKREAAKKPRTKSDDAVPVTRGRRSRSRTQSESMLASARDANDAEDAADAAAARRRAITKKRLESRQRNLEERERQRLERQRLRRPTRMLTRAAKSKREYKQRNNTLLEEAQWFQSITGNGACVAEGDKRKRVPTYHLIPEFQDRQKLKHAQKKLMERKYPTEPRIKSATPSDFDPSVAEVTIKELQDAMGSDSSADDEKTSPFDPCSIVDDTCIEATGRDIYNEQISSRSLFPVRIDFSPSVHEGLDADKGPVINDILAAKVIRDHEKGYTSLPSSFPPFRVQDSVNPRNILHIRYLLYPQHTEQYILAQPKSNQLDPVNEIQKVFQIHYGLYFSYSEELKNIIYKEYCEELVESVHDNDFSRFMNVIDKWNALMLELTPYPVEIDPSIDINASLRDYLPESYKFHYNAKDFRLQKFFMEVLDAGERAKAENCPRRPESRGSFSMKMPSVHNVFQSSPEVFVSRFRHLRPMAYSVAFIDALTHVSSLSRFCIQQMILRAYVRIVSPESRKLRSYKAFSAEVYGELLPPFVSEVLTRLDFKPGQKFYDLGCGVGNATFQAALEFGASDSGGCEIMEHASNLASLQSIFLRKQLQVFGLKPLNLSLDLYQSFVANEDVRQKCQKCDVILVNNFLFEFPLNVEVGKLLYGLKPGSKIISLRNFISPRYKASEEKSIFDFLKVEKFEISDYFSVSWTANKVPYYVSTVQADILPEYLPEPEKSTSRSRSAS